MELLHSEKSIFNWLSPKTTRSVYCVSWPVDFIDCLTTFGVFILIEMASEDIPKFKGLNLNNCQDINILLLGETGVGKSTFINAIANYLNFVSLEKAAKSEDLLILIPTIFSLPNKDMQIIEIKAGSDNNEYQKFGSAGTQDVKTYVFPIGDGKSKLRLIDSPGMGDPRGIEQDDINCENILTYLSKHHDLHAICFLMKPTNTRITVYFEYCVKQIFSRLEKSASRNIVFIFTNTRGNDFTPGDTLPSLKIVLDDIKAKPPHVEIPLTKDNTFSVDNEAFRYLVAKKNNFKFEKREKARFLESWNNSSRECWRLISYIVGDASHASLPPHQLENTMSINEARRMVVQLSRPLADITQLIYDNLRVLDRHRANLAVANQSLDELKQKLYIPVINLEVRELRAPITICTSPKCAELVKVGDIKKWHYKQRCHDPCYLKNVDKEIVGHPNLLQCDAMNGTRTCRVCSCDFSVHMHVYYLTKTVADRIIDKNVKGNISQKRQAVLKSQRLIEEIETRKRELEKESKTIINSTAQFANFLQYNAISPFYDSYKAYIKYLIEREKSLGKSADEKKISHLKNLFQQYTEMKAAFEASLQMNKGHKNIVISVKSVFATIDKLYNLKHNGKKIREIIEKQKASRISEHKITCEYVHPKSFELKRMQGPSSQMESDDESDVLYQHQEAAESTSDDDHDNPDQNGDVERSTLDDEDRDPDYKPLLENQQFNNLDLPPPYPGFFRINTGNTAQRQTSQNQQREYLQRNCYQQEEQPPPYSRQTEATQEPKYQDKEVQTDGGVYVEENCSMQ